jgi:hypothetical protein
MQLSKLPDSLLNKTLPQKGKQVNNVIMSDWDEWARFPGKPNPVWHRVGSFHALGKRWVDGRTLCGVYIGAYTTRHTGQVPTHTVCKHCTRRYNKLHKQEQEREHGQA